MPRSRTPSPELSGVQDLFRTFSRSFHIFSFRSSYLRAKVRFFDADPAEEEMEKSTSTALHSPLSSSFVRHTSGIRQKMRDALAIQGDMEQAQELGDLARRLHLGGGNIFSVFGASADFDPSMNCYAMLYIVNRSTDFLKGKSHTSR